MEKPPPPKKTKKFLAQAALVVAGGWALSVDYTIKSPPISQGCYRAIGKDESKRMGGADFCHNCRKQGGDFVAWRYTVFCEGKPTQKTVWGTLQCERRFPDEGIQRKSLRKNAKQHMEAKLSFSDKWGRCDRGGW